MSREVMFHGKTMQMPQLWADRYVPQGMAKDKDHGDEADPALPILQAEVYPRQPKAGPRSAGFRAGEAPTSNEPVPDGNRAG